MVGYLALCHSVGVPPSLAVFVVNNKHRGWYCFRFSFTHSAAAQPITCFGSVTNLKQ
jgi:hypothetical protein